MISRNFYLAISIRLIITVILAALSGYLLASGRPATVPILFLLAVILLIINLILFINRTNDKIRFFFDAVRNEDSNLAFPVETKNKSLRELYRSMNTVNQHIQQLKVENRQQEQYFRRLIEHLATGIMTFNEKGFILHANSAAKRLLSADVLTHLQQIERINIKLFQAISNIKPLEQKLISIPSALGNIQLSLKATSVKTGDEQLTILSIQDIKNELDEKELDSWLKLIRVLMHEIMNSLTPITSLSESLSHIFSSKGKPVLPEELDDKTISRTLQGLNVIQEQGKGLMSFVESYRRLTRIPEPEKKKFKVADLLKRVQVLYKSLENSESIDLSFKTSEPDMEIYADENLISQVLINLLKNALEANENNPSGKISILSGADPDKRPEICVADNGPGISENMIDEIFVPFFTTRKDGSGIGLSISKQIMRVHGGNLKVRSVPGKETIFCLSFPN
ncbi:MAG: ATP-binding protein [Bacteroidales bacterium]|nr:ATP-binding protein [Bacteroidales bacterium]